MNAALAIFDNALDANASAEQLQVLAPDLAHVCGNEARAVFPAAGQPDRDVYGTNSVILGQMREVARVPEAAAAVSEWLGLVDGGQYPESWKAAAEYFKRRCRRNDGCAQPGIFGSRSVSLSPAN